MAAPATRPGGDTRVFIQGVDGKTDWIVDTLKDLAAALAAGGVGDPAKIREEIRKVVREEIDRATKPA